MKLQKHKRTYWWQSDRRVTVADKSSANALAGFSSVQMAPSSDVARGRAVTEFCRGRKSLTSGLFLLNRESRCEQLNQMGGR